MEEKDIQKLEILFEEFLDVELLQIFFSNSADKEKMLKAKVRPFLLNGRLVFQLEKFIGKQAFHQNLSKDEAAACFAALLNEPFRQCEIQSGKGWAQVLVSRKGTITIKRKAAYKSRQAETHKNKQATVDKSKQGETGKDWKAETHKSRQGETHKNKQVPAGKGRQAESVRPVSDTAEEASPLAASINPHSGLPKIKVSNKNSAGNDPAAYTDQLDAASLRSERLRRLSHNRVKAYVLEEGIPVPFLIDLGVMTREGKVVRSKYDKFRQINRFLEFIEDILPQLSKDRENTIIDFGCGKSYLTFAMYHYLKVVKGYKIRVIGLDLKQDVIDHCNELSRKYGFQTLQFYHGDIASYEGVDHVDMVVTLHACDTATDYALAKAVGWGAKVILSVPCCQHEWNRQMKNEMMKPVLQYGILKERMAALYTDGMRAQILEHMGYRTQILEFIDMEHTPKNILIRAVYQGKKKDNRKEIQEILNFWGVNTTLWELLLEQQEF
ncbi:MAG: SAM-dependent methyltransferase [Lachnospiraceae bacterium]|nr:SAM-dependent methyltransferase [Lachnospiraceae bacterium]